MDKKYHLPKKVLTEGLPCHKFILRQLGNANDAKVFVKNYVSVMVSAGMEHKDIETSLAFMSSMASRLDGTYRFDVWNYNVEGFDLIDNIVMDNGVAVYKKCRQFYRKYDTRATACALCPLASAYKNSRKDSEAQVIRYCLDSRDNFEYVLSKDVTADMFCAVVDVTESKSAAEKPCIYPFFKRTFEALLSDEYAGDLFNEGMDYSVVLEKYHSSKVARFSNITKDCSTTVNTFCAVMISNHLPMDVCSLADVDRYIKELQPPTESDVSLSSLMSGAVSSPDGISTGTPCNLGLENLDSFYDAEKRSGKKHKKKIVTPGMAEAGLSSQGKMVEISLSDILSDADAIEDVAAMSWIDEIESSDMGNAFSEKGECAALSAEIQLPPVFRTWSVSKYYADAFKKCGQDDGPVMTIREIKLEDSCKMVEDDSRVGVPLVKRDELEHFSLNLDTCKPHLLSLFESYVLKDKRLSVELVLSGADCYLLMYSPKMHAYFHSSCAYSPVRDVIGELLSYSSIVKYCYSPYMLVSMLRKFGLRIKNLWSLHTLSSLLYRNHREPMESMLLKLGAVEAVGGVTLRAEGEVSSVAIKYMHCYHNLFHHSKRLIVKRGLYNEYVEQNKFDLALSLSYQQAMYSDEASFLFKLSGAGSYVFHAAAPTTFREVGKSYCVYFRHSPERVSRVIIRLLCELYDCGILDKGHIMLLGMGETFFSYYVSNEDREYLDLRINRLLLKYLKQNGLRGIEYYQSELVDGRIYPEHRD